MTSGRTLHHFRFHVAPKGPLRIPAYNKGNVIRGGFGSTFRRIVCHATAGGMFVIVLVGERPHSAAADLRAVERVFVHARRRRETAIRL